MYDRLIDVRRLRDIRADRGLTIRELHRRTGVSYSMLKYVEKGQRQLSEVTAAKVAKALDCRVDEFTVTKPALQAAS